MRGISLLLTVIYRVQHFELRKISNLKHLNMYTTEDQDTEHETNQDTEHETNQDTEHETNPSSRHTKGNMVTMTLVFVITTQ